MSTATMSYPEAFAKIESLEAEAKEVQQEADAAKQEADAKVQGLLAEIQDVLSTMIDADHAAESNGAVPIQKKSKKAPPNAVLKKNANSTVVAKKKVTKKSAPQRKRTHKNDKPLKEVVWNVLSMGVKEWRKIIPTLPKGITGLKASEIVKIIETQELWLSHGGGSPQIAPAISDFRKANIITRGEKSRYEIKPGSTFE